MKKITAVFPFVIWLLLTGAMAQSDSLLLLPIVEVHATHLHSAQPGLVTESWKTAASNPIINQSAADFLRDNTGIYLKSYGPGSLTTTSIRGASAGQTAVVWNGFQIQSPMLGLLDWSLLPIFFTDEISFQHGANAATWGSGAMGGALLMNNRADFATKRHLQLSVGAGSFGLRNGQIAMKFAGKKWATSTRFFHKHAENDFSYSTNGQAEKRQTNAANRQDGILQEIYWKPNANHQIGIYAWVQASYREIPPTTVQTKSVANQKDEALRTALHWQYAKGKTQFQLRTSLFLEAIDFRDELAGVNSQSHFWTNITEGELLRFLTPKLKLQLIGNQTFTKAFTKYYADPGRRHQFAVASSLRYENGPWSAQMDIRQELLNKRFLPIIPSIGVSRNIGGFMKIGCKMGRTYRVPTLNDLYWVPGGNLELLPESGWAEELNAQFNRMGTKTNFELSAAVFNRKIQNWIQWLPKEGSFIWSAANIKAVKSRGLEIRMSLSQAIGSLKIDFNSGYGFVRSTNLEAIASPHIDKGQQWFYVPKHQGFLKARASWNGLGLTYLQNFTGPVNTELGQLPAYRVANGRIEFSGKAWGHQVMLFFLVENCWDSNYRVVERRPMPGRSYQIGSTIILKK